MTQHDLADKLACEREARSVRTVADDTRDAGGPLLGVAGADDGFHVGAAAGDQDDDVLHGGGSVGSRPCANLQSQALPSAR